MEDTIKALGVEDQVADDEDEHEEDNDEIEVEEVVPSG